MPITVKIILLAVGLCLVATGIGLAFKQLGHPSDSGEIKFLGVTIKVQGVGTAMVVLGLVAIVAPWIDGSDEQSSGSGPSTSGSATSVTAEPEDSTDDTEAAGTLCDLITASIVSIDAVPAIPLQLPDGGARITVKLTSEAASSAKLPAVTEVTFLSDSGAVITPERPPPPGLGAIWFQSVSLPAGANVDLDVITGVDGLNAVSLEITGVRAPGSFSEECTLSS